MRARDARSKSSSSMLARRGGLGLLTGRFIFVLRARQGPGYTVKAVSPDGTTVPIPALWVRRGGDRYRLLPDSKQVVYLGGDYGRQDFWLLNLENGSAGSSPICSRDSRSRASMCHRMENGSCSIGSERILMLY